MFSLTKNRTEALSDGIFAIVMTLLVMEIKIPHLEHFSESKLYEELLHLVPLFLSYFLSFAFLATTWIAHHFVLALAKNASRKLIYLNILLLSVISLVPFFSHLLGSYSNSYIAISSYSICMLVINVLFFILRIYIYNSSNIDNHKLTKEDEFYANIRSLIGIIFPILAIFSSRINTLSSLILLIIPIVINLIPGFVAFFVKKTGFYKFIET